MRGLDWIILWTLSLIWGGSFLFNEIALQGLPALTIVWGRVALAAVILWLVMVATGTKGPPRRLWPPLLVMGLLNNAVPFTLFVLAQGQITGALASVLNATTPLFTVLVAHLATTDERLTPRKALGVALGFGGVLAMMVGENLHGEALAMLACLGAALSYGLAGVWGRRFRQAGLSPIATACGQVTSSTVLITPLWLILDRPWHLPWPGAEPVLAVLALAIAVFRLRLSSVLPRPRLGRINGGVAGDLPDPAVGGWSGMVGPGRDAGLAASGRTGADPVGTGADPVAAAAGLAEDRPPGTSGQHFKRFGAQLRVALRVQPRRPDGDRGAPRCDGQDAAAHPGFARQTDADRQTRPSRRNGRRSSSAR
jgi:drug/metabolite transporter (DMT)-like permease